MQRRPDRPTNPENHFHKSLAGMLHLGSATPADGDLWQWDGTNLRMRLVAKLTAIVHAMTSAAHTAGNWKTFYSNGSGTVTELALGADGTYLRGNGTTSAPTMAQPAHSELSGVTSDQHHARSHAITGTSDHTAGNWKEVYTNGSGGVIEVALGASGTALVSTGTAAAPTMQSVVTVIDRVTTEVDISNSTTETTIYDYTVAGGTLGTSRRIRVTMDGIIFNDSGAGRTVEFQFYWAGTVFLSDVTPSLPATAANNYAFRLILELAAQGATNSQTITAQIIIAEATTTLGSGGFSNAPLCAGVMTESLSRDSTADQHLKATAKLSTASANLTFSRWTAITELL